MLASFQGIIQIPKRKCKEIQYMCVLDPEPVVELDVEQNSEQTTEKLVGV